MTRRAKAGFRNELVVMLVASTLLLTAVLPSCIAALACDMPCCADDPVEEARCIFGSEGHRCELTAPITTNSGWTIPLAPAACVPMILTARFGPIRSAPAVDDNGEDPYPSVLRLHVLLSVFRI